MTLSANQRKTLCIAGNGFIGRRVAGKLAAGGSKVLVHHTGRNDVADSPEIESVIVEKTPPPIVTFPNEIISTDADVAIHFYCMGADDAEAFVGTFDGQVGRLVLISSCDVYRAYGRFIKTEPGPHDSTPLDENAPLRERLFPYRSKAENENQLEYWYDKVEAERIVRTARHSEFLILRLPRVYGPESNNNLESIYNFAEHPDWRWTHGHVDNVAAAVALAAYHPKAAGQVFNLGEDHTPTMGERLQMLPPRPEIQASEGDFDFEQDLHFDTSKIHRWLEFQEVVNETDEMKALTLAAQ